MIKTSDEKLALSPGLREQLKSSHLHKFEMMSRDKFQDLMMEINLFNEREEEKLKKELKNIKGSKKKLIWKKE